MLRSGTVARICQIAPADRWLSDAGLQNDRIGLRFRISPSSRQVSPTRHSGSTWQSMVQRKHLRHALHADDSLRARGRHPVTSGSPRGSRTEAARTLQTRVVWVSVTQQDRSPGAVVRALPTAVTCCRCPSWVLLVSMAEEETVAAFHAPYIALYIRVDAG